MEEKDTDLDTVRHRLHAIESGTMIGIIGGRDQGRQDMEETDTEAPAHGASLRTISHSHAVTHEMCQTFKSSHSISLTATFWLGSRRRSRHAVFVSMSSTSRHASVRRLS